MGIVIKFHTAVHCYYCDINRPITNLTHIRDNNTLVFGNLREYRHKLYIAFLSATFLSQTVYVYLQPL